MHILRSILLCQIWMDSEGSMMFNYTIIEKIIHFLDQNFSANSEVSCCSFNAFVSDLLYKMLVSNFRPEQWDILRTNSFQV